MMLTDAERSAGQNEEQPAADGFAWFEGGPRGARSFPTCSLTKSGSMTLNDVAVQVLGDPPAVRVGYNAQRMQIGLKSSLRDAAGAVQVKPSWAPDGTDTGSRSMYARSVLLYYGVLPTENHLFRLEELGDGVFALSLDEPLPKGRAVRREAGP